MEHGKSSINRPNLTSCTSDKKNNSEFPYNHREKSYKYFVNDGSNKPKYRNKRCIYKNGCDSEPEIEEWMDDEPFDMPQIPYPFEIPQISYPFEIPQISHPFFNYSNHFNPQHYMDRSLYYYNNQNPNYDPNNKYKCKCKKNRDCKKNKNCKKNKDCKKNVNYHNMNYYDHAPNLYYDIRDKISKNMGMRHIINDNFNGYYYY